MPEEVDAVVGASAGAGEGEGEAGEVLQTEVLVAGAGVERGCGGKTGTAGVGDEGGEVVVVKGRGGGRFGGCCCCCC